MCIVIYQPKGKSIGLDRLFQAQKINNHGYGVAWARNEKIHIFKTMDFDLFLEKYAKVNRNDCLIHFRLASIGKKDKVNCHPFRITKNLVMAHNGTIRGLDGSDDSKSDTRTLAHDYIRPMCKIKSNFVNTTNGKRWLGTIAKGMNKLVFMNQYGTPTFINGDLGHWSKGCWYSNRSYAGGSAESGGSISIKNPAKKGYGLLSSKTFSPKATPSEIINHPLTHGKIRSGRSLVDEIQDEIWDSLEIN